MALTNATVTGGALVMGTGSNARSSIANAALPKNTASYEVNFNMALAGAATGVAKVFFTYNDLIVSWKTDGSLYVVQGANNFTSSAGVLSTAAKYHFDIRRKYDAVNTLSTFEIYVNGVKRVDLPVVGTPSAIPSHDLSAAPTLMFGNDTYSYAVSFDDIRVESIPDSLNTTADGAGIFVEGNGKVGSKKVDRSITWRSNTTDACQDLGDNTGSYWHVQGGQVMFSRTIDSALRRAPGSTVVLSSLPAKSEPHLWTLSAKVGTAPTCTTADSAGSVSLTYTSSGNIAPTHTLYGASNYFETKYGDTSYLTSYYGTTTAGFSGTQTTGLLFCGTVKPVTSLSLAIGGSIGATGAEGEVMTAPFTSTAAGTGTNVTTTADMVELFTVGDPTAAGKFVSVYAWRGGRILMFTGLAYTQTINPVVSSSDFAIGVCMTATEPQLYINGVLKTVANGAMSAWRTYANVTTAVNSVVTFDTVTAKRGVFIGARTAYTAGTSGKLQMAYQNWRVVNTTSPSAMTASQIANTQLYRYAEEYDAEPLTVTYGFRIGDDETLQIVKTQGSYSAAKVLGNPAPASETVSTGSSTLTTNTLGTINDSAVDVVLELLNRGA
eukprot:jgi/Mesvir1/14665/Mv05331-RA.1